MQTVSWAGSTYNIPNQRGDTPWSGLSDFAIAVAAKGINTGGGNFTLLADLNLGASFGLISTYFKSRTANIATAGVIRLASADTIQWRNNANGGNVSLSKNTSDELLWNGSRLLLAGGGLIVNADISASAAIAFSKMAALTVSRALVSDGAGVVTVATTTATEIGYVNGVTSAIQTQLDSKTTATIAAGSANQLAYYTGAAAIAAVTAITASRALASDSNGLPVASATTAAELAFVNGVTSAIQTQIDAKATDTLVVHLAGTETVTGSKTFSAAAGNPVHGTNTNDNAAAGFVGELIETRQSAGVTAASTTNYKEIASITLTAGDWDICALVTFEGQGGATSFTSGGNFNLAVSTTTASEAGTVFGTSWTRISSPSTTTAAYWTITLPRIRVSLSGSTTYYLNASCVYTSTAPQEYGIISARRVR